MHDEIHRIINIVISKNYDRIPKNYYFEIDDWKMLLWEEALSFLKRNSLISALLYTHLNQFLLNRIQDLFTKKRNINIQECLSPETYVFQNIKAISDNIEMKSIILNKIYKIFNDDILAEKLLHIFLNFFWLSRPLLKKKIKEETNLSDYEIEFLFNELKKFLGGKR